MSDEQEQAQELQAPASADSEAVQAALKGIPGLAESVGSRPADSSGSGAAEDMSNEPGSESEQEGVGAPKPQVEDSETVQRALKQLGLQ